MCKKKKEEEEEDFISQMLTYFKSSIFRILIVLEIDLLFGNYIRFGITISLGNIIQSCSGIIIRIEFMIMFFYIYGLEVLCL